jgi:hypothetical protein
MRKIKHLYRFRSIRALLDEHHELENQYIYFSPPGRLNDPLEGFKDIYWCGDTIVWTNLLRHYLLNLIQVISIYGIKGRDFTPDICNNFIFQTDQDLPKAPIRDMYVNVCREFLGHTISKNLIDAISSRVEVIRRDELIYYLRLIHPLAISKVSEGFEREGIMIMRSRAELDTMIKEMVQHFKQTLSMRSQTAEMSKILFPIFNNSLSQIFLIHEFNNPVDDEKQPLVFITRDFPNYYVNALEHLIHPKWYVACFIANPTNMSMWGTYADSHKGACLKFKTQPDGHGAHKLDLYRINGLSGNKTGISKHYEFIPHRFEKIFYNDKFPEIDFFESIGMLPMPKLGFWYTSENGKRSTTGTKVFQQIQTWRQEYWDKFVSSQNIKSRDWKNEKEHRLTLHSLLESFDDPESRKLKYKFTDLSGIVFGIKTSTEDKLRIMRIIEHKCIAEKRTDFEFYQARYSTRLKKIEHVPLRLLKITI